MSAPVILVTGATDGIGRATAIGLARRGAHLLVHGRSPERAAPVVDEIRQAGGTADAVVADFASLDAVRRMAQQVRETQARLDVLINNAGVHMKRRELSADGYEMTFQVNHLAHFLLTVDLLPLLEASAPARIVNVSSQLHRRGQIHFDDLHHERDYDGYTAYANSKVANVLFTHSLARRLAGRGVTANALHPGVISTKLLHVGFGGGGDPVEEGARTSILLALSPDLATTTGRYFRDEAELPAADHALDDAVADRLWTVSEALVTE